MWATFCDLAMAGGPPHKGALLEPAPRAAVDAAPERYDEVVEEICRGVTMVTDLGAYPAPIPGWVHVDCFSEAMAGWLLRAIVMENVSARTEGLVLALPAGPDYRLEKEIKNVITVIAKTCHYWTGHMWLPQRRKIAALLAAMAAESPVDRARPGDRRRARRPRARRRGAGRRACGATPACATSPHRYVGWLGVECPSVPAAVWMMRLLVAEQRPDPPRRHRAVRAGEPGADPEGRAIARARGPRPSLRRGQRRPLIARLSHAAVAARAAGRAAPGPAPAPAGAAALTPRRRTTRSGRCGSNQQGWSRPTANDR